MRMSVKRFLAASLLVALPLVVLRYAKKTHWGQLQNSPPARQKGDPSAKVLIVQFSDFQCPSCATVEPAVHQFLDVYKGKIKVLYKYYPLTRIHKNAMPAAHAAECAARQNQFWPYHDKLYETQRQWALLADPTTTFMSYGKALELDMDQFRTCYADPTPLVSIEADAREAVEREVRATPTFFVGEERLVGNVFMTDGARAIEKALRQ